ncbi:PTS sugar transporter subunit IIC [uncultured Pseudodesulfovibrio sp.]|uniref:PTS sugar transporter subunit IIC n=1 Tax=uncultured Pseudodesulfovibrio sp. TaxID=2035858 RepID=UPI0029C64920|nr:PTS sugar transporter subunit IIC [uncultured Pseudodesulfovibrio sp.]
MRLVCHGRFFFALFSQFRSSISIGLLERPLVVGFFWGAATGEYTTSLYIAIFFELFWLDLIPAGTYIPPQLTAATFSALALTTWFGLNQPSRIMFVLFASMPLAWIGTKVEGWLRDREQGSYNALLNWARNPGSKHLPGALILRSITKSLLMSWVTFLVAVLILKLVFDIAFTVYPNVFSHLGVTWAHLWVAASLGGLMALRLKRAYVILATGVILFALYRYLPTL